MSILIVDDNAMNSRILEYNLKKNGYQTFVVSSGEKAIECLEAIHEIQLVISDIMMPGMSGLELLEEIRKRRDWRNIPVIMCTSLTDSETVRKAAKAGCRDYIIKPIRSVQLIQKVRELMIHEEAVLRDRSNIVGELEINYEVYEDLRRAFTDFVADTIEVLGKLGKEESLDDTSVDLMKLLESASLMGAERVKKTLRAMLDPKSDSSSDHLLLLRDLKVLLQALTGNNEMIPSPPDEQSTDTSTPDKQ